MKKLILSLCLTVLATGLFAQSEDNYIVRCIAFYNLENLFDTIHDEGKNDFEYLPNGGNRWTSLKYKHKLKKMAYAISQFGLDKSPLGAVCIGVAEVENIHCLEYLVKEPVIADLHYKPILLEGPDRRGVDVGFLYNPSYFTVVSTKGYQLSAHYSDGSVVRSRLQLLISGYLKDDKGIVKDKLHILVNHWPSRYGGEESSRATRDTAAMLCKHIADSLYMKDPGAKIIIMGDLNDDPYNHSCAEVLGARKDRDELEEKGFYNTMWKTLDRGIGSLAYNGSWNLFDQIIISEPLAHAPRSANEWSYWQAEIFNKRFLTVPDGKDKGTPLRTHKGGVWLNGYSDHYPTMIYLVKQK